MKKKLIKISKIFLVLTLIFSQLSSITKVLADEITNDDILVNDIENIEEETNALVVDGYLNYLEDESLMSLTGIKDGNSFKYTVGAKVYTQILTISGDDIDDNTLYSVKVNEKDSIKMTGSVLKSAKLEGTITDLTNSFNTIIKYTDKVEITEVQNTETTESTETQTTEKEPIVLEYNAVLVYEEQGNSFDEALTNLYDGYIFSNGNLIVNAKELPLDPVVPSVEYLYGKLNENNGITLEISDREGNIIALAETLEEETSEEIVEQLVKNGYTLKFTKGLSTSSYNVIVMGDITDDSIFNKDDMKPTMDGYLAEENIPSMDLYLSSHETEVPGEFEEDTFGTITFEDIMTINGYLNPVQIDETQDVQNDNTDLRLILDVDNTKLYVGDTFKVNAIVKSNNIQDYINGITGLISNDDKVKLLGITFNEKFIGTYNDENSFVGAGSNLVNDETIMTFEFMAISEGKSDISVTGMTASDMNIDNFDELTIDVEIFRKSSVNNLNSLNSDIGTFDTEFDKDVTVYTLIVPSDAKEVILSGSLEDPLSTVDGLYKYELNEDKTTAIITVTAEDGSTKTYTVYIIKERPVVATPVVYYYSSNNYLKILDIDGYELEFNRDVTDYQISVDSDVKSLDITAVAEDSRARVEITGNEGFKSGKNTVIIAVKAENGDIREYKLLVNKVSNESNLTEIEDSSNTAEKVVIIILIILVVFGLLYLIFKKDDDDKQAINNDKKKDEIKKNSNKK